ncbi:MAG: dihydrodipicolinate synthase family protein [Chloroflexi bacterium]|nr:dihydrodipicolinate synthase family protein [Chloroflexota bacterium]
MSDDLLDRLAGPLVPVMPAFRDDQSLDLDATARWIDGLITAGIGAFWTTFGTSHYLSLSDAEIDDLTAAIADVTRGRAVFVASTQFHWPLHQCLAFAERAARSGADVIKVQVDWRLRPAESVVLERYRTLAAGGPLPLLAYALGGATFGATAGGPSADLFRRLLEIPEIIGMKNDAGDFYEQTAFLAAVRASGRRFEVVTGGSMESFLHGRQFGQRAYAVALAMLAPAIVLGFERALAAGDRAEAIRIVRDIEQPFTAAISPLGHWAALHEGLRQQGRFPSRAMRFPLRTLTNDEAAIVGRAMAGLGIA